MLIGSIAEAWLPKCERVLVGEIIFQTTPTNLHVQCNTVAGKAEKTSGS